MAIDASEPIIPTHPTSVENPNNFHSYYPVTPTAFPSLSLPPSFLPRVHQLAASISNDHIYLVYEFVSGSNLALCLRNPRNPDFTVLSTWMSRMQIATDLAHGLDYIHNTAGFSINLVHKHVKSSEPSFNARICHFGAAELCSETGRLEGEITEEDFPESRRSESRGRQFEGVRGYMSPEFKSTGVATRKSDVYAFGMVTLELLSGEEPVKYTYDKASGEYKKFSIIETATEAVDGGRDAVEGGGGKAEDVGGEAVEVFVPGGGGGEGDAYIIRMRPRGSE